MRQFALPHVRSQQQKLTPEENAALEAFVCRSQQAEIAEWKSILARNYIIASKTANDIDGRVKRVLRGLDYPEPPLCLDDVRELLQLDREFYTADDPGIVKEVISRMRVGGIQVYRRPTLLIDAIKKLSLKALYIPDSKRILLDETLPILKHRWNEAHEIGHSIIPWHHDVMLGDNRLTLSQDCQEYVEAEANFAAGRLLFLRDRFSDKSRISGTFNRKHKKIKRDVWKHHFHNVVQVRRICRRQSSHRRHDHGSSAPVATIGRF